ncbi:hypothetical protein ACFE04_023376 [Oxalis oulophora]
MQRVFSVEEIPDPFWSSPPSTTVTQPDGMSTLNRSSSEWAFQRFIQEVSAVNKSPDGVKNNDDDDDDVISVVEINDDDEDNNNNNHNNHNNMLLMKSSPKIQTSSSTSRVDDGNGVNGGPPLLPLVDDAEEYQAFLKKKLNLACAAVALQRSLDLGCGFLWTFERQTFKGKEISLKLAGVQEGKETCPKLVPLVKTQDSGVTVDNGVNISNAPPQSGLLAASKATTAQKPSAAAPVLVKPTTSGSSRELSDDDEAEGENETGNGKPTDVKRVRRMLSNRESARRSRSRKQAHITELETMVSQLRSDNSSLLKRYADISQKYNDSLVDNRILKADVETLRTKVKMSEDAVKRITGVNSPFHMMPHMSIMGVAPFNDTSADAAVPVQDGRRHLFYQPVATNNPVIPIHNLGVNNNLTGISAVRTSQQISAGVNTKMGRTASLQRVASLEHLQKRIRGGVDSDEQ